MIKAIIFDADGVLIRGEYFYHYLQEDFGIDGEITQPFFTTIFMDCVVGKKDLRTELPPYLKEWGWKGTVDDFIDYWHKKEHNLDDELVAYIQELRSRGIMCCVATNQHKERFTYMLKEMGFEKSFDRVYASSLLGHRKPSMEFYEKLLTDLSVPANEILFWDDRQENIDAAKELGINAELYTTFDDFKEKIKSYNFGSF